MGPSVFSILVSAPPDSEDQELKKIILQNFSDIATQTEAMEKLREMKMPTEQPILSYNSYYAEVHEAAFDMIPEQQHMRFALESYTNFLPEYTARKLSSKIVKKDSQIKTLQEAMDQAVRIDQESRQ